MTYLIPKFHHWHDYQTTIPKMYWDVKSQEQRIHRICENLHKLACYADLLSSRLNIDREDLDLLISQFEEFKEHGFDDYYLEQVEKWIEDNLATVMQLLIRQVYFGLTDDTYSGGAGYFVAYIPESWNDIVFDTGAVFGLDTYGRLILRWDADSPYSVEQKPEYSEAALMQTITELENRLEALENA